MNNLLQASQKNKIESFLYKYPLKDVKVLLNVYIDTPVLVWREIGEG